MVATRGQPEQGSTSTSSQSTKRSLRSADVAVPAAAAVAGSVKQEEGSSSPLEEKEMAKSVKAHGQEALEEEEGMKHGSHKRRHHSPEKQPSLDMEPSEGRCTRASRRKAPTTNYSAGMASSFHAMESEGEDGDEEAPPRRRPSRMDGSRRKTGEDAEDHYSGKVDGIDGEDDDDDDHDERRDGKGPAKTRGTSDLQRERRRHRLHDITKSSRPLAQLSCLQETSQDGSRYQFRNRNNKGQSQQDLSMGRNGRRRSESYSDGSLSEDGDGEEEEDEEDQGEEDMMEEDEDLDGRRRSSRLRKTMRANNQAKSSTQCRYPQRERKAVTRLSVEQQADLENRYQLRNRDMVRRVVSNVGGQGDTPKGGGYGRRQPPYHHMHRGKRALEKPRGRRHRKRHYDSSSESTSSSYGSSSSERHFRKYQRHKFKEDLESIQPLNNRHGSIVDSFSRRDLTRADASPLDVDPSIGWESVGGLKDHIVALKEMVMLPLLYPEYFERFSLTPPRGVLFYGPPGTGKTLVARALANSCTQGGRHVAFFMRKGADCLSKWVGEAERQLRLLFEQARRYQPSIIFFDEIDGLAPVRSSKQDQIHASIVSTLLALMDGLDNRGQVIVIGATNRPDAIDPALRRPGRFDRELAFTLPDVTARRQILDIHTKEWNPPMSVAFKNEVAEKTVGYCGADIKSLCTEAAMRALRRRYPQIYESSQKLLIKENEVMILRQDFAQAMRTICPAAHRAASAHASALPQDLEGLLDDQLESLVRSVKDQGIMLGKSCESDQEEVFDDEEELRAVYGIINKNNCEACHTAGSLVCCDFCPSAYHQECIPEGTPKPVLNDDDPWRCPSCHAAKSTEQAIKDVQESSGIISLGDDGTRQKGASVWNSFTQVYRPRLLITGRHGMGQSLLGSALLHHLEVLPVYSLDLPSLLGETAFITPEQCLVARVGEARRHTPSILYVPNLSQWWLHAGGSLRSALITVLTNLSPTLPVLVLATTEEVQASQAPSYTVDDGDYDSQPQLSSLGIPLPLVRFFGQADSLQAQERHGNSRIAIFKVADPTPEKRRDFFREVLVELERLPETYREEMQRKKVANKLKRQRMAEVLPVAPPRANGPGDTEADPVDPLHEKEKEEHFKRELRICLRQVIYELRKDKKYSYFWMPVDPVEVPDYYEVIANPMDLETMRSRVDAGQYVTVPEFMDDIELILDNAKQYNPQGNSDQRGRAIVSAAHNMIDHVHSMLHRFKRNIGYNLFKRLEKINARKQASGSSNSSADGKTDSMLFSPSNDGPTRSSRRTRQSGGGAEEVFLQLGSTARSLRIQGSGVDLVDVNLHPNKRARTSRLGSSKEEEEEEMTETGGGVEESKDGKEESTEEVVEMLVEDGDGAGMIAKDSTNGLMEEDHEDQPSQVPQEASHQANDEEDQGHEAMAMMQSSSPPQPAMKSGTGTPEVVVSPPALELEPEPMVMSTPGKQQETGVEPGVDGLTVKATPPPPVHEEDQGIVSSALVNQDEDNRQVNGNGQEPLGEGMGEKTGQGLPSNGEGEEQQQHEKEEEEKQVEGKEEEEEEEEEILVLTPVSQERLSELQEELEHMTQTWGVEALVALRVALWRVLQDYRRDLRRGGQVQATTTTEGDEVGGLERIVDRMHDVLRTHHLGNQHHHHHHHHHSLPMQTS